MYRRDSRYLPQLPHKSEYAKQQEQKDEFFARKLQQEQKD